MVDVVVGIWKIQMIQVRQWRRLLNSSKRACLA